ncbi:MAG: DUF2798 domain-containing protein [Pseudomonadota bacterium]
MIPKRLAPYVIALLVSGGMSFMVSGLATARATGLVAGFVGTWLTSWLFAWAIAFPALVVLRPIISSWVMRRVREDP